MVILMVNTDIRLDRVLCRTTPSNSSKILFKDISLVAFKIGMLFLYSSLIYTKNKSNSYTNAHL